MDLKNVKDILSSDLLEQYVLGLTSDFDSNRVEEWARQHEEIRLEIQKLGSALESEAFSDAIKAPEHLKGNILQNIQEKPIPKTLSTYSLFKKFWFVPAASLILGAILAGLWYGDKLAHQNNQISELATQVELLTEACNQNQNEKLLLAHLQNEATVPVVLSGSALYPEAKVIVYWNEELQAAYLKMIDMPLNPEGTTYQLWGDVEGVMIDMGVLKTDTETFVSVPFLENAESLNITLEPAGGSKHPTVEKIYASARV
jgi:anti-sigma-K factor RskA